MQKVSGQDLHTLRRIQLDVWPFGSVDLCVVDNIQRCIIHLHDEPHAAQLLEFKKMEEAENKLI